MPQRTPTGRSLSSTALPCASKVLRPSDCHLEVAPITTATCLPFVLVFIGKTPFVCSFAPMAPRNPPLPSAGVSAVLDKAESDDAERSSEHNIETRRQAVAGRGDQRGCDKGRET